MFYWPPQFLQQTDRRWGPTGLTTEHFIKKVSAQLHWGRRVHLRLNESSETNWSKCDSTRFKSLSLKLFSFSS